MAATRGALLVVMLLGACAAPGPRPGKPFESGLLELPPFGTHELCLDLRDGDVLEVRFLADPPMKFRIARERDDMLVAPLVVEPTREFATRFTAREAGNYCLLWEGRGDWASLLRFRIALLPG